MKLLTDLSRRLLRAIKPAILPQSITQRQVEFPVFCLGPSPMRWHRLFSQQTSNLVERFEQLCNRGTPFKREIEDFLWKLKRARRMAVQEVNQTRIEFERRSVALLNAMTISPSGSQILYWGGPTLIGSMGLRGRPLFSQTFQRTPETLFIQPKPLRRPSGFFASVVNECALWWRFLVLWMLFTPAVVLAPFALGLGLGRASWTELVRWTLEHAGPAFIKWGQWGATRPDLLPVDLCRSLERLHNQAPEHRFRHTRREVEASFGMPLEELFSEFDPVPIASGSIAQVHKAKLGELAAAATNLPVGSWVAVKVRHPHVQTLMERDFTLMVRACEASARIPFLSGMRLEESMRQFGAPLHKQLDLRLEAGNLKRFKQNFRHWRSVGFPSPLFPLVSPSVLVESFEDGDLISNLVHNPDYATSVQISQTGLDLYLKMLMRDNFLHADLHPGNILVQDRPKTAWTAWRNQNPKLVLLDAGMVAELTPQDQKRVLTFFQALTRIDGADVARTILDMAVHPKCNNPHAFVQDMKELFDDLDFDTIRQYTQEVIQDMLDKVRRHEVTLKGSVCTLMATTLVLEGWSTKLNPEICIMDRLKHTLPKPWKERLAQTIESIELKEIC